MFRTFPFRQRRHKAGCQRRGIDHLIFGVAGMNIASREKQVQAPCIKTFLFNFSQHPPVHGVAQFSHPFQLDKSAPAPISSSGVKTIRNSGWGSSGKCLKRGQGRHDLGNTGFVIGSQKRPTIAENEGFAHKNLNSSGDSAVVRRSFPGRETEYPLHRNAQHTGVTRAPDSAGDVSR
jgi:hypothetical protein